MGGSACFAPALVTRGGRAEEAGAPSSLLSAAVLLDHAAAAFEDVGEGFAEGGFEAADAGEVVGGPAFKVGGDGNRFAGEQAAAFELARFEGADDGKGCLAVEGEVGEDVLLAVAGAVPAGRPGGAVEDVEDRLGLGEHAFEPRPEGEDLFVAEPGEPEAGRPAFAVGIVEAGVIGFGDEVGEGRGRAGEDGEGFGERLREGHRERVAGALRTAGLDCSL